MTATYGSGRAFPKRHEGWIQSKVWSFVYREQGHAHSFLFSLHTPWWIQLSLSPASGNCLSYIPFMFHVNASLSFCPSISISSLIGTRTSGWDAFSWITAGSWSSKLTESNNTANATSARHLAPTEGRQRLLEAIPKLQLPPQSLDSQIKAYRAMATNTSLSPFNASLMIHSCK